MSELSYPEIREYLSTFLSDANRERFPAAGFSIDSRTIQPGEIFITLKGASFDGHDFIEEAVLKGARGVVYQDNSAIGDLRKNDRLSFFKVNDSYNFIYQLARYKRIKFKFPIIAVTGSNGKTTVKELTAAFLNSKFSTYRNYLNQNNLLGLSLNILNCNFDYDYAIFEIGISKKGEMDILLDILKPDHGLITNISSAHLEFLRNEENVFNEKVKLFEFLKKGGFAFYSKDQDCFKSLDNRIEAGLRFKTFGLKEDNDCWLRVDKVNIDGLKLNYRDSFSLNSNLLGYKNGFNISAAISVATELGIDLDSIAGVLSEFKPLNGRMNYEKFSNIDIIDDSYNSNPQALAVALEFISSLDYSGLKIAVLSDMSELGRVSDKKHLEAGIFAANLDIDYYFCCGSNIKHFVQGLKSRGFPEERILFLDQQSLVKNLATIIKNSKESSMLFFKASHGMHIDDIIKKVKERII
ncbi:MAG: UDP-N-acetylmuramoyl-tripeptide--D-alanyl-D-alanine ligase [Candidatus Kaelpia imicola]|nr:UDP-N-acetylmuramoyl-tripeptide--D-alanyl-D-alanine ligase [Candidatus Kaelpia imicola]